jgi:hypothetical protein
MAARKTARKTTRKKTARRKTAKARTTTRKKTAKKAARRKAVRRAAAKSTTRRKASKKKASRKRATASQPASRAAADLVGDELPRSLKAFGRQVRRDLRKIEQQIEVASKDTRRSLARIIRDASHQLGALEARGDREWRSLGRKARGDVERLVKRVRKAVGA